MIEKNSHIAREVAVLEINGPFSLALPYNYGE